MNKIVISMSAAGLLFITSVTHAGAMRCGMHIVSDSGRSGPGKYEVLKKCGEPTERYGNTWIYDKPGQSKSVLTFDDRGLLVHIKR